MKRPSFESAWNAAQKIYDTTEPEKKVATIIGGAVARNINAQPPFNWKNTCAVRISYILNQSGTLIPQVGGKTVTGEDKKNYFYRVKDVIGFLNANWDKPDSLIKYPLPPSQNDTLAGKKGLILFEVTGWGDAAGHATLWNGNICYDHCYFNEPGVNYKTDKASFWSLL
jgi:hypothetical protein